jgi:hypothetical protein
MRRGERISKAPETKGALLVESRRDSAIAISPSVVLPREFLRRRVEGTTCYRPG